MNDDLKYIDVAEFRRLGYLQEVNRLFFHPAGLALSVRVDDDGTESLAGIWDYRGDPEGMLFGPDEIDLEKVARVEAEVERHAPYRRRLVGSILQQVGLTPEQMAAYEPLTWDDAEVTP